MSGARRVAAKKARTSLNDARILAEQFRATGNLQKSFDAFLAVIKTEEKLAEDETKTEVEQATAEILAVAAAD